MRHFGLEVDCSHQKLASADGAEHHASCGWLRRLLFLFDEHDARDAELGRDVRDLKPLDKAFDGGCEGDDVPSAACVCLRLHALSESLEPFASALRGSLERHRLQALLRRGLCAGGWFQTEIDGDFGGSHCGESQGLDATELLLDEIEEEIRSNLFERAALLNAKKAPNSANCHVSLGKLESVSKIAAFLDGSETRLCSSRKRGFTRMENVGCRLLIRSPDAPAELVHARQPHHVSIADDDCVDVRNVEPRLNDGGADEDIVDIVRKSFDNFLQVCAGNLPVRPNNLCGRNQPLQLIHNGLNHIDSRHDVEHLTASRELILNSLSCHFHVPVTDDGPDWFARSRRGADGARVTKSHH
mmetsp:Transcript_12712/g.41923  ORF Transcript_12712/g.41923 Transcript_12712/m.41923 type:complete len:357 (-) Transcript_12712:1242-2312(-)